MERPVRASLRITAALLILGVTPFVAGCARVAASVKHTCSATDKQFLATTQLNMNMLGYWSSGLANFAHDVLTQAEPALAAQGCNVSGLL